MKRVLALLLTMTLAIGLVGCEAGTVTPEDIRDTAALLEGVAEQMEAGETDFTEFHLDFDLAGLDPAELIDLGIDFTQLDLSDLKALGIDLNDFSPEQLEAAGLKIAEMTEAELKAYGIDLNEVYKHVSDRIQDEVTDEVAEEVIDELMDAVPEGLAEDLTEQAEAFVDGVLTEGTLAEIEQISDAEALIHIDGTSAKKYVDAYTSAKTLGQLYEADAKCYRELGISSLFDAAILHNPVGNECVVYLTALPAHETSVLAETREQTKEKGDYLVYIGDLYKALGFDSGEAALRAATAFAYEREYAEYIKSLESDSEGTPVLLSGTEAVSKYQNLPLEKFLRDRGESGKLSQYYFVDSETIDYANSLWNEESLEDLKNHAVFMLAVQLDAEY